MRMESCRNADSGIGQSYSARAPFMGKLFFLQATLRLRGGLGVLARTLVEREAPWPVTMWILPEMREVI